MELLTDREIVEASCLNHRMRADCQAVRLGRRAARATECLHFFYFAHFDLFSLDRSLYLGWKQRVHQLFCLLPEFFAFLEERNIRALDLGIVSPFHVSLWREQSELPHIRRVLLSLLRYLRTNRTLHYCHIGLFQRYLTMLDVYELVHGHPTLGILYVDRGIPVSFYRRLE